MPYVAEMSGSRCIARGAKYCLYCHRRAFTVVLTAPQRWNVHLLIFHAKICSIFARNRPRSGDGGRLAFRLPRLTPEPRGR
jgi:hypothetical protein